MAMIISELFSATRFSNQRVASSTGPLDLPAGETLLAGTGSGNSLPNDFQAFHLSRILAATSWLL